MTLICAAVVVAKRSPERPFLGMKLGLDLKGGSHLLMQVVTDDAVKAQCDLVGTRITEKLRKEGFPQVRVVPGEVGTVAISGIPAGRTNDLEAAIKDEIGSWPVTTSGDTVTISMPANEREVQRDNAVKQAEGTIRNRIDQFGVGETNISASAASRRTASWSSCRASKTRPASRT